jgi:hypothetical protein
MRIQILGLVLLAACGGGGSDTGESAGPDAPNPCLDETRADTYVVGLDKHGTAGKLDFQLMSADPAPPARGNNTWVLQLSTMTQDAVGAAASGAVMTATPFMPDHQHGTPIKVEITPMATAGQYQLTPVNLWMPGYWETTVNATVGSTTDTAVFKFCIPQ